MAAVVATEDLDAIGAAIAQEVIGLALADIEHSSASPPPSEKEEEGGKEPHEPPEPAEPPATRRDSPLVYADVQVGVAEGTARTAPSVALTISFATEEVAVVEAAAEPVESVEAPPARLVEGETATAFGEEGAFADANVRFFDNLTPTWDSTLDPPAFEQPDAPEVPTDVDAPSEFLECDFVADDGFETEFVPLESVAPTSSPLEDESTPFNNSGQDSELSYADDGPPPIPSQPRAPSPLPVAPPLPPPPLSLPPPLPEPPPNTPSLQGSDGNGARTTAAITATNTATITSDPVPVVHPTPVGPPVVIVKRARRRGGGVPESVF